MIVKCKGPCGRELEKNEDNFYKTKKGGLYGTCKQCARERSAYYQNTHKRKESKWKPKNVEFAKRHTVKGFTNYMKNNPFYFKDMFGVEPTPINIKDACNSLI